MTDERTLPPPTFEFLIISTKTQIELHLGLLQAPGEAAEHLPKPDLRVARHLIDTLAMLQEKTKNNLTWDEERLLNNVLTELRFRYIQVFEQSKKAEAGDIAAKSAGAAGQSA